jgi:predicted DNA-binding transcriptional regulator AlpA
VNASEMRGLQNSKLLLSMAEVCELLSMSESAIRLAWRRGEFPQPLRIGRKKLRWRVSDLARWLNKIPTEPHPSTLRRPTEAEATP